MLVQSYGKHDENASHSQSNHVNKCTQYLFNTFPLTLYCDGVVGSWSDNGEIGLWSHNWKDSIG